MEKLDMEVVASKLIYNMKDYFQKSGFTKAVLGLSGGLDSAVVAVLAARALGKENVTGLKLPYKSSSTASLEHADEIINMIGISGEEIEITSAVEALKALTGGEQTSLRAGNIMARIRMTIIFDYAAGNRALVLGTSNKSELLLGYGTLFGDMASIVNPLGELYKTQVKELASYLGISDEIVNKPPSADLSAGQTDEADFGFSYFDADQIMSFIFEENKSEIDIMGMGFDHQIIKAVTKRVKGNKFKFEIPVILKIK